MPEVNDGRRETIRRQWREGLSFAKRQIENDDIAGAEKIRTTAAKNDAQRFQQMSLLVQVAENFYEPERRF